MFNSRINDSVGPGAVQPDRERAAVSEARLQFDAPTVLTHERSCNEQPEAHTTSGEPDLALRLIES